MDHINKKIRQMRRFKVVFKRPSKRAKTPSRDTSISAPSSSNFKCPNCCVEKSDVATQTTKEKEDVNCKTQTSVDASIQVNITPTRIPRLLGPRYSGSSDSSMSSPPINHDAACQTMGRSESPTDTIPKISDVSRPSTTSSSVLDSVPNKRSSSKHKVALGLNSSAREKSIRCQRTLPMCARVGAKSSVKSELCLKGSEGTSKKVVESGDSEKDSEVHEGKKPGHMRRSSSSSGIPVHVKLRSLQSPRVRHLGISKESSYFPPEFNTSSTNSSDLSPCGDFTKASSEEDSDPTFWNPDERCSILSETYTLDGAGDFLLGGDAQPLSSPEPPCSPPSTSSGGLRKPLVFLRDPPGEPSRTLGRSTTTP